MAGAVHQTQSVGLAEERKKSYDLFRHNVTKESLWTDSCFHPQQPITRGLSLSSAENDVLLALPHGDINTQATAFRALLRTCAKNKDLYQGARLYDDILQRGLLMQCSDALITMYAKCGALAKAKELLDMHKSMDVITWTALIAGYACTRQAHSALDCFEDMQCEGIHPNAVTYVYILKACGTIGAVDKGEQFHDEIARQGLLQDNIVLGTALVDMYAKCRVLSKARRVLEELPSRDVVSWNALIAGYAQEGQGEQALNCFDLMQREGIPPSSVTYICILKACSAIGTPDKGKQIHDEIVRQGLLQNNTMLGNALVDMYAKCGALSKAQSVLEGLPSRDVASWSALIVRYAQEGQAEQALSCYERMQHEGIPPDAMTYASILKACGAMGAIDKGKQIHDKIVEEGLLQNDFVLGTALIDMYAKCGALSRAQCMLEELPYQNVVPWNALIAGYAQEGQSEQALICFECMQYKSILPDAVTYICILKACGNLGAADKGKQIHEKIVRQGLLQNNIMLGTALVDMYAKCSALSKAQHVFEELSARDVASWSALIAGYTQQGQAEQALSCFERMQNEGIPPNAVTYAYILKACGTTGAIIKGKQIHVKISQQGLLQNNIVLGTALVDMYAKCGALSKAELVLEELPSRDVASWNALIAGYTQEGQGEQALSCFDRMQCEGVCPDAVTLVCVLNVCSHLGLVEEGHAFFVNLCTKYGVKPDLECYTCMVDLFGRAGHLERAVRMIQEMPSSNCSPVWLALLGACWKWRDVNIGRWAFEQAVQVDKSDAAAYVLMSNIYADAGMKENAKNIQTMQIGNQTWKKPEHNSWIDLREVVHAF